MNRIILLAFFATMGPSLLAQNIIGKSYISTADNIEVFPVMDSLDNGLRPKNFKIPLGTIFRVDDLIADSDYIKISFWKYEKESTQEKKGKQVGLNISGKSDVQKLLEKPKKELTKDDIQAKLSLDKEFIGYWSNFIQFKIKLKDLDEKTKEYNGFSTDFTYGVMTLPIKLRFGNGADRVFEFEENLNLGFHFGVKWQLRGTKKKAINALVGVGISRVDFTQENFIDFDEANETGSALTLSLGSVLQYDKFQVGLFVGTDHVAGTPARNWKFQGKPWIGVGLGLALFTNDNEKESSGINNK